MIHALTAAQAREAEETAVAAGTVTLGELMKRAGTRLAEEAMRRAADGSVAVVCGGGNNGGDGWVAARTLHDASREVTVFSTVPPEHLATLAGDAARAALGAGVRVKVVAGQPPIRGALAGHDVVIDALLGIGISGEVRAPLDGWIEEMNATTALVIAADIPSGVDATTGAVLGSAVEADVTVTFLAPKTGCVLYPGAAHAGEIVVADLGVLPALLRPKGALELWGRADYRSLLPRPSPESHKNTRGRVLVVAGSQAFPGAATLAASGAQRAGAGYVVVAVPEPVVPILQAKLTSAIIIGLPEDESGAFGEGAVGRALDLAGSFDAVVLGPGMTSSPGAVAVARSVVASSGRALVVDADGLNALVGDAGLLRARSSPTVITPHPGELARLCDSTPAAVQSDRLSYGRELTGPHLTCVLKGARTVVSDADRQVVTRVGGPELATAGTGDVLAGMVGALLAQGLEGFEAAALGTYLHGRAGGHASEALSQLAVIAEDVLVYLPAAIRELDECI
ncbi:MAG: NAD(P)H-hydrate dehydratase [Coriobacteriia bacterium]|nr:NAD(P)H-hydrate dehydratase [Coriobacteriia bacterium]